MRCYVISSVFFSSACQPNLGTCEYLFLLWSSDVTTELLPFCVHERMICFLLIKMISGVGCWVAEASMKGSSRHCTISITLERDI